MWVSKRFDIEWADLIVGAYGCVAPVGLRRATEDVERLWGGSEEAMACLSVRSGFDLLLEVLDLPRGTDVLFSALTVADMPRIAREHGLNPVSCDLDPVTGAPGVAQLEAACTPETKILVLAHLFGARMDIGPLALWARDRGILIVEDCAQAYAGLGFRGHEAADISFFSFGPIKHATALGGGMAVVRDPELLRRMREIHSEWSVQPRLEYLRRVIKYSLLHALADPRLYTVFAWAVRALRFDLDSLVNRMTRGFSGAALFRQIRRRPSAPLLRLLGRRFRQDVDRFGENERRARQLLSASDSEARCPGAVLRPHTFWLLPILSDDPVGTSAALRHRGFDATLGRSLVVVGNGTAPTSAPMAEDILERCVFVPFYPSMPDRVVDRLTEAMKAVAVDGAKARVETGQ